MSDPLLFILRFIFDFWWLIFPALLIQIVWDKFKDYKKSLYFKKMSFSFMEIKFPAGITRTPRAMEEVFNALHAAHPDVSRDLTWWNLNINGFVPKSYAFLIIAHDGRLRFYIRFPQELKEFVKTRFYSQYPDVQFEEVNNPFEELPPSIPNSLFDVEIFDVRLIKEDAYPIKTYVTWEKLPEEQQIDPISNFSEAATQVSNKEWLVFQILALPTTGDNPVHGKKWVERGKKVVDKLIGKEESKEPSIWEEIAEFIVNLFLALFKTPEWKTAEKKETKEFTIQKLTPGEKDIVEAIEIKLGKLGYWCNIRAAYISSKDIFYNNKRPALHLIESIFKSFTTENLNGFSLNPLTFKIKKIPPLEIEKDSLSQFILKKIEFNSFLQYKPISLPERIKQKLKDKKLEDGFILNSEELASIFHPPMGFVPPTSFERIPIREFPPPIIK